MSETKEAGVRAAIKRSTKPSMTVSPDRPNMRPRIGTTSTLTAAGPRSRSYTENRAQVHQTFLKGTTDTIEDMDIRFATTDVAVATVISVMSPFTSPDGVETWRGAHIRTLCHETRRSLLIMQDHNTTIVDLSR